MTSNVFLAVDLSDDERHDLAAALSEASPGTSLPGKRPPPESWHLTLRFLGPIDEPTIDRVSREVAEQLDLDRGRVVCEGLAAFPKSSRAHVLFAAVRDDDHMLTRLAAHCEAAAVDVGLEPEGRPFVPHLTLSRLRPPMDVRGFIASFGTFKVTICVDQVVLMRSHRTRGAVRYLTLDRFPLG